VCERERERERQTKKERERELMTLHYYFLSIQIPSRHVHTLTIIQDLNQFTTDRGPINDGIRRNIVMLT
jgi:hypothetical protein